MSDALVTKDVDPLDGQAHEVVAMCHSGEHLAVIDTALAANGTRRVRTAEGWISIVSNNGTVLLDPLDPGTPGHLVASEPAATSSAAAQTDGNGGGGSSRAVAPPQKWLQWAEAQLRDRAWAEAIWGVACIPAGLEAAEYQRIHRGLASGVMALIGPPTPDDPAPVVLAAEAVVGRRHTTADGGVTAVRLGPETLLVGGRTLVRCPLVELTGPAGNGAAVGMDPEAVHTAWIPARPDGAGLGVAVRDSNQAR